MPHIEPTPVSLKAAAVQLILDMQPEKALEVLSQHFGVEAPKIKVGLPKGRLRTAYGTYSAKSPTICVLNSDIFGNPFVVLHEFYHHLRSQGADLQHRGTEKNADKFAADFLRAYQLARAFSSDKKDA